MPDLLSAFGLMAVVLTAAALTSGLVARAPISSPMIFLALGFLLGERGLGLIHVGPHSAALEAIAVLSLSFVLFLDAINLRFDEMGKDWIVPVLALGPGTILTVLLIAGAATLLLALPPTQALLLGAILSRAPCAAPCRRRRAPTIWWSCRSSWCWQSSRRARWAAPPIGPCYSAGCSYSGRCSESPSRSATFG
jgi:hypothetical protein